MTQRIFTQTFGVVGAIVERDGKILLVKETKATAKGKWSHPAGWIDVEENSIDAVKREVKEETGFDFEPKNILGVYVLVKDEADVVHHPIKIIYIGTISEKETAELADDVSETKWFTPDEIENMDSNTLRDLDIKQMVKDYFSDTKYPLNLITHTIQPK
jgi:ADP-ribose pyrophosphatase YjhB (NUDIX family)